MRVKKVCCKKIKYRIKYSDTLEDELINILEWRIKKMNKKKIKLFFIVAAVLTSLFIMGISRKSFLNYEKNIIMEQQEQLLTISRLVARGLLDFTEEQINKVNYLGENIREDIKNGTENQDKILEVFSRVNKDQILKVEYVDFKNQISYTYPEAAKESSELKGREEFEEKMKSYRRVEGSFVGGAYEISKNSYAFDILTPIYIKGSLIGVITTRLGINKMYDLIAKPIKVGKYGYVMVKNSEGIIIMHPLREQVGYDILVDRKKKYPDLDYSELEELVKKQLSGVEGSYIYHSYWWPQEKLEKVKKFQSFTSVNMTEKFWIVAVTTSYEEVAVAIRKYLQDITIVALTLISIITTAFFIILRMISTEEAHRVEVNYLKDINESSESLRRKEVELHKKKKLESIGTLTGGIAHEFNNILTPIMGYSEMILMDLKIGDENYDEVKEINNLSKRARDIIGEILKFSGNKNTKTKYEFLEVEKVVERSLRLFETLMPLNIRIKKNISPDLGSVYANESQLYQVILDLCISTYRSMEEDDRELEVNLTDVNIRNDNKIKDAGMDDKNYIKLTIKDRKSISLDDEEEKILKRELSSVMEIVSKHGGRFFIEKGLGRAFEVYLPKVEKKNEEIDSTGSSRGTERVLIIDDEELIVEMLQKKLGELGYRVTAYTNSESVLKDFNILKDKIDVVISDVRMPEVSGVQIAKKFRRNKPEVKIILITGNTEEPLEEHIQSHTIDDYILKPISVKQVNERIRKVLEG